MDTLNFKKIWDANLLWLITCKCMVFKISMFGLRISYIFTLLKKLSLLALAVCVINTLVRYTVFLAADTLTRVLIHISA